MGKVGSVEGGDDEDGEGGAERALWKPDGEEWRIMQRST